MRLETGRAAPPRWRWRPHFVRAAEAPDVPDSLGRLRRAGFIEIENSDLRGAERYIPVDRVRDIANQTVRVGSSAVSPHPGSAEPTASVRPSSPMSTGSGDAMPRTREGTPRYVRSASGPPLVRDSPPRGCAVVGLGAIASALLYRQKSVAPPWWQYWRCAVADGDPDKAVEARS